MGFELTATASELAKLLACHTEFYGNLMEM